jgi:hypothetical protein
VSAGQEFVVGRCGGILHEGRDPEGRVARVIEAGLEPELGEFIGPVSPQLLLDLLPELKCLDVTIPVKCEHLNDVAEQGNGSVPARRSEAVNDVFTDLYSAWGQVRLTVIQETLFLDNSKFDELFAPPPPGTARAFKLANSGSRR